jgi:preprotein translocase subunit SecA
MAGDYKKALHERKLASEDRRALGKRYLGILASFSPDHPSVQAVRALSSESSPLRAYLDAVADVSAAGKGLSRSAKEKIAKAFYPQIEDPVDFLAVHPLKARIEAAADTPDFAKVLDLLDRLERERVVALGGLHILATERHEARRIDNQLRGRAGRQGDPGSSRFYLSLEDDLMRIFGSDRISGLMLKLGMEEGVPIEHGMVTKSIERAQKQVEAQNFAVRKHLLEYDDVMNKQRTAVYDLRRMILEGKNTREHILKLTDEVLEWYLDSYIDEKASSEAWNLEGFHMALKETFGLDVPLTELKEMGRAEMLERIPKAVHARYLSKEEAIGAEQMLLYERMLMLQIVDTQWKDHLYGLDHLKEGIGLRGYGQRDPLVEYKKESFKMYQALMDRIDEESMRWIYLYQPVPVSEAPPREPEAEPEEPAESGVSVHARPPRPAPSAAAAAARFREPELAVAGARSRPRANLTFNDPSEAPSAFAKAERPEAHGGQGEVQTVRRDGKKVGRNDPCPCGSGKKYKKCHG